ncbi:hypothetical protein [Streptomyces sp. NPDC005012]|uniref:hypothetical protein n=1 Tax=Streptomyces sp. NPDC005012 TaxID=3154558 RepID=UPI0033B02B03
MGSNDDKNYDALISDELQQVQENADVINIVNAIEQAFDGFLPGGGTRFFGRTSFEGHRLNDMIDMVEPTKPEQVEEVGTSLLKAGEAINAAAQLLGGDIDAVDWEGDSGDAFRTWSKNLVTKAEALATYSKAVGEQITLAGSGLASVRKSMPPRDTRDDPKSVSDIPPAKRVESNEEYAAALKAEQHRQEAINQMIRLSSFYAVSEETLAAQEPPTFEPMPNVAVPPPSDMGDQFNPGKGGRGQTGLGNDPVIAPQGGAAGTTSVAGRVDGTSAGSAPEIVPNSNGSMQIDSVATAPPPQETTRPVTAAPTPTTTGPAATVTPVPPVMTNLGGRPAGGTTGGVNARQTPITAQGQAPRGTTSGTGPVGQAGGRGPMGPMGPTGQQVSANGRTGAPGATGARGPMSPMGPTGQPTTTGRAAGARGATGPVGPTGQPTAAGRTGAGTRGSVGPMGPGQAVTGRQTGGRGAGPVIGGMPASHGTGAGGSASGRQGVRPVQSGATAAGGVVGGRPAATAPNGPNGTRVPRGTVIGGDAGTVRGAGEQPGRRGVVGVPGASAVGATGTGRSAGQQGQSPKAPPGGVVGAPRPTGSRRNRGKKRSNDGERREKPPTNG